MKYREILIILLNVVLVGLLEAKPAQKFACLGDFELENGEKIIDCRVGYRTYGELNDKRSNAILYPTWFEGTTEHMDNLIGEGKFLDPSGFYIITIDAFGNGVSSSPSNSIKQPGEKFPRFSIHDMVKAEYIVLTEKLGIDHLYGMIGGSMGSFQVFEWLVAYPDFADKALPYVCSPKLTSYDLLLLHTQLNIIESSKVAQMQHREITKSLNMITALFARTPNYMVENTSREEFPDYLLTFNNISRNDFDIYDKRSQIRAMLSHDITRLFDRSMAETIKRLRTEVFIMVSETDHIVNPQPAKEFARLTDSRIEVLQNNCGHLAIGCEMEKAAELVNNFFRENSGG